MKIEVNVNGTESLVKALNALTEAMNETSLKAETKDTAKGKKLDKESKENTKKEEDITLEEVRGKLASLSQNGKQAQVKALIKKFGAKKLSEIPKEKYGELLKEAEVI